MVAESFEFRDYLYREYYCQRIEGKWWLYRRHKHSDEWVSMRELSNAELSIMKDVSARQAARREQVKSRAPNTGEPTRQ